MGLEPITAASQMQYATYCITTILKRRGEVPTPKHFTVQSVFKTVLSPTELPLHLPTYRCRIGLWFCYNVQTMRELNPILHIDSVICKPLHHIAYIVEPRGFEPL